MKTYVVKPGDTLEIIAKEQGLCTSPTVCSQAAAYIARTNGIVTASLLSPGQHLLIPEPIDVPGSGYLPESSSSNIIGTMLFFTGVAFVGSILYSLWDDKRKR